MKTSRLISAAFAAIIAACAPAAFAQLTIPSDGSDGALVIASNTVIDLSRAVTGNWNDNDSANAGKGIYDSNMWAVVFKYSSVTISNGAALTFTNHGSHAPLVWLVTGDVTINGSLVLDGQPGLAAPGLAEPGPGGFRGGTGYYTPGVDRGPGFGPGGGQPYTSGDEGSGGSYGTVGSLGSPAYGNASLIPLIGGSGGAGRYYNFPNGGGAGGGAVLVACGGNLTVAGTVSANGGYGQQGASGGSGGGIRLVANTFSGSGIIQALGGAGDHPGGLGRIRIERVTNNNNSQVNPDPSILALQAGSTPVIWPPSTGPSAKIISIGNVTAPADPRASFGTFGPDVALPEVTNTQVLVETTNVETAAIVNVRVSPRANAQYTEVVAGLNQIISTNPMVIRWLATNVPVQDGYSSVIVRVVRP
ncbi:MAG TPA: hypothetical protein VH413_07365 [Verrucomicrobiae bacterium]|jgi:hypothetical protein|nr:hypothetical protein [Verrucomicrobiae bacterium]